MSTQSDPSSQHFHNVRLKWILDALESGRREVGADVSDDGVLSVGGEHIGWRGEWKLDNPRYVSQEYFRSMSSGQIMQNDVLLVKDGATIGKTALASTLPAEKSVVNEHVFLLRFSTFDDPRCYFYFIQSQIAQDQIHLHVRGSSQPGLNTEFVNVVVAPRPPKFIQKAIADHLDRETARLDALVAAKERLLARLAEKRRAVVTRAVARGLDPRVPTRDSGVPWLGAVPAHWDVERARWLFRERDQRSEDGTEELLTVSHLTGVTPRSEKDVNMFEAETLAGYKICRTGDLVINTLWAWMGAMGVSFVDGVASPAYNVYEPTGRLDSAYVDALSRLPAFAQEVVRHSKGVWSSRLRLYPEEFFEILLPVPPLREQRRIVAFLEDERKKIDDLQAVAIRTMELLKERRAALVAAAVTGQLDIENASLESPPLNDDPGDGGGGID